VPINTARQLLPQLQAGAQLEPVWLGISAQPDPATPQAGLTITQVVRNSAAAQADLQPGDVLTAVNGTQVNGLAQLSEQLAAFQPSDRITLTLTRNGQAQQVDVTLQPWPETIE
jgi:putative serine protease PepD